MSDSFQERRKHLRVYENFMIFFSLKGKTDVTYEMTQINNISRGGMYFTANTNPPAGSELIIELSTPFSKDIVHLEGKVLESSEKLPHALYGIRVEFTKVTDFGMAVLIKIEEWAKSVK